MKRVLLALVMLLLLSCDGLTSPKKANESLIEDILSDIRTSFLMGDLTGIMDNYDAEYLHNGRNRDHARDEWNQRLAAYDRMDYEDISISINDDRATASFTVLFSGAHESETLYEPQDNGNCSYFIKHNGVWMVWGNRDEMKKAGE